MIICGTYGSKKRSCNYCKNFMLWGVTYGFCITHAKDFPAQHVCKRFKKHKEHRYLKEIYIHNRIYYIDCYVNNKKTMFVVLVNDNSSTLRDVEGKYFHTLRDVMNAIKKDK